MNTHARRLTFPILCALALVSVTPPLATDTYLPAFPQVADALEVSATTVQLTLTAFMLGMAAGQLVIGAISDVTGRRGPLILSTALALVATMVCMFAPGAGVLIAARFAAGFFGGGGVALARAAVADLTDGAETARSLNLMQALGSLAPILAPTVGGLLLTVVSWRGIFGFLAVMTGLMVLAALFVIPESRPRSVREAARGAAAGGRSGSAVFELFRNRAFLSYLGVSLCASSALFTYISGSPFVYQEQLGVSSTAYGFLFGANAIGMTVMTFIASRPSTGLTPFGMAVWGAGASAVGSAVLLACTLLGAPAWMSMVAILGVVAPLGWVLGNSMALAMMTVRSLAGTASAVVGSLVFVVAALVSPLVGLGNPALIMSSVTGAAGLLAVLFAFAGRAAERSAAAA